MTDSPKSSFPTDERQEIAHGAKCLIIYPEVRQRASGQMPDIAARLEEARGLALAIGLEVQDAIAVPVRQARAATLIGGGQIDNIRALAEMEQIELIIVDGNLSAIQQRNLEEAWGRKVIDRTGLILEIFGERATTAEGRLQVELAHLDYQQGRLVRSWTHLERQRGGFGFLGGPGETQIEADRRMIRDRMGRLRRELDQVRKTRALHRQRRQRAPWPVIALVGYTNAGKSTLFNHLTGADVLAQDMLFATLDPTMRAIDLSGLDKAILSDTVGFVSDLPTQLVAAFRATLEEVISADCIIHVRDMAHPQAEMQRREVESVLRDLGVRLDGTDQLSDDDERAAERSVLNGWKVTEPETDMLVIEAWNKWELVPEEQREILLATRKHGKRVIPISALTGEGVEGLMQTVETLLNSGARVHQFAVPSSDGQRLAWLHSHGDVSDVTVDEEDESQMLVTVKLSADDFARYRRL